MAEGRPGQVWRDTRGRPASGRLAGPFVALGSVPDGASDDLAAQIDGPLARLAADAAPEHLAVTLRIGARALEDLASDEARRRLARRLDEAGLALAGADAVAVGPLSGAPVKDRAFLPDWGDEARLHHTTAVADLADALAPPGQPVAVTTLPGARRGLAESDGAAADIADSLLRAAAHVAGIERRSGRRVTLAVLPTPFCLMETAAEAAAFFRRWVYSPAAIRRFAALADLGRADAADCLPSHLGLALDTAHAALAGEDVGEAIGALRAAGIPLRVLRLSVPTRLDRATPEALASLIEREGGRHRLPAIGTDAAGAALRIPDLAEPGIDLAALDGARLHVLARRSLTPESAAAPADRSALEAALAAHRERPLAASIEMVGPASADPADLARDLAWLKGRLAG